MIPKLYIWYIYASGILPFLFIFALAYTTAFMSIQAPHVEVLEHVSTILKEYGFYPTAEVIDTMNLYFSLYCFTQ